MSLTDGILDLPVFKGWFEKIKNGEKTHEYRNTALWQGRLGEDRWKRYHTIRFRAGQVSRNAIYAKILNVSVVNGNKTDLKINHDVFDIEFELIKG